MASLKTSYWPFLIHLSWNIFWSDLSTFFGLNNLINFWFIRLLRLRTMLYWISKFSEKFVRTLQYEQTSQVNFRHRAVGRSENLGRGGKSDLISEGILTFLPLPTKCAKSRPWAENLYYIVVYWYVWEIQIFCSGARFDTFWWQCEQSQNTFWEKATFIFRRVENWCIDSPFSFNKE